MKLPCYQHDSYHSECGDCAEMNEPCISVSGLRKLATAADTCGAKRYAEAFRIVADRLMEIDKAERDQPHA